MALEEGETLFPGKSMNSLLSQDISKSFDNNISSTTFLFRQTLPPSYLSILCHIQFQPKSKNYCLHEYNVAELTRFKIYCYEKLFLLE